MVRAARVHGLHLSLSLIGIKNNEKKIPTGVSNAHSSQLQQRVLAVPQHEIDDNTAAPYAKTLPLH